MSEITVSVTGMKCGGCTSSVEKALNALPGAQNVEVSLEQKTATISGVDDVNLVIAAIKEAGFEAEEQ